MSLTGQEHVFKIFSLTNEEVTSKIKDLILRSRWARSFENEIMIVQRSGLKSTINYENTRAVRFPGHLILIRSLYKAFQHRPLKGKCGRFR